MTRNEVTIGTVAKLNNLTKYRKFLTFIPSLIIGANDIITSESHISVKYAEYVKLTDGTIYQPSYVEKTYVVTDVPAKDGKDAFPAFTTWFTSLARTPIDPRCPGILDMIEATLAQLPLDVPDGYILQEPLKLN